MENLLNSILNIITDGVIILNNNGTIIYHNTKGSEFLCNTINDNYSKKYIDKNIINLIPQFDFLKDNTHYYKNREINLEIEKDNKCINYEIILNSLIDDNNITFFCFLISEKHFEEQKQKCNFIGLLSHELRNPLQSLVLANDLLQKKLKTDDQKINLYINTINKSSHEMKRIINDILDLSKIENNEFDIILEIHNLNEIISDLINSLQIIAKEKNIILKSNINYNTPKTIFTDITRINQILHNLISNAIKYSPKNSVVNVNVNYNNKKHGIEFNIIDQGMGIPKAEWCNIFKENGKTSNSFKNEINSNGFGLYLSQNIANLLDGNITFNSIYNKGSTFTLFLPIKLSMNISTFKNNYTLNNFSGNILIVDDEEPIINMLKLLFENIKLEYSLDISVDYLNDGGTAIKSFNNYNLIFMDINMDGIDGISTTKIIRETNKIIPIIATTGNISIKNNPENKIFTDILIKPYDEKNILFFLNKYLAKNNNISF